jgi:hypothetical protein
MLYNPAPAPKIAVMSFSSPVLLAAIGLIGLVVLVGVTAHFFSPEAKLERRRRRNNYRVISKAKRPIVTLNARTKK